MPQKDAEVQLQNAAAVVNQWHAAYMEVMDRLVAHVSPAAEIFCVASCRARHCSQSQGILEQCQGSENHAAMGTMSACIWLHECDCAIRLPGSACCGR